MHALKLSTSVLGFAIAISNTCLMYAAKAGETSANQAAAATPTVTADLDAGMKSANQQSIQMSVVSNVADQAAIQAVLIPASVAQRIFGREISQNYAVVEVIISNRDSQASLLVHSIFLDYSNWLLSGVSTSNKAVDGLTPSEKANTPTQVASVESRLVRGELLDAQPWTLRNWTMRTLVAVSGVAAGFEFPFSGDVAKGIAAFSGTVVPGAAALWPDGTINQINRIADYGFQTDKVIPKQGADIVIAFFPIDRFLTKSFKQIFLKTPSALFVPGALVGDPKMAEKVIDFVGPLAQELNLSVPDRKNREDYRKAVVNFRGKMLNAMLASCSEAQPNAAGVKPDINEALDVTRDCKIQHLLNQLSLNNIHVVVEGSMTVDTGSIPATVSGVAFDGSNDATVWASSTKSVTGTITGLFLSGGTPSFVDKSGAVLDGVTIKAVTDGSTDTKLKFTMTLTKCVKTGTAVYLTVTKPSTSSANSGSGAGNSLTSTPFELTQQPTSMCAPPAANGGAAPGKALLSPQTDGGAGVREVAAAR